MNIFTKNNTSVAKIIAKFLVKDTNNTILEGILKNKSLETIGNEINSTKQNASLSLRSLFKDIHENDIHMISIVQEIKDDIQECGFSDIEKHFTAKFMPFTDRLLKYYFKKEYTILDNKFLILNRLVENKLLLKINSITKEEGFPLTFSSLALSLDLKVNTLKKYLDSGMISTYCISDDKAILYYGNTLIRAIDAVCLFKSLENTYTFLQSKGVFLEKDGVEDLNSFKDFIAIHAYRFTNIAIVGIREYKTKNDIMKPLKDSDVTLIVNTSIDILKKLGSDADTNFLLYELNKIIPKSLKGVNAYILKVILTEESDLFCKGQNLNVALVEHNCVFKTLENIIIDFLKNKEFSPDDSSVPTEEIQKLLLENGRRVEKNNIHKIASDYMKEHLSFFKSSKADVKKEIEDLLNSDPETYKKYHIANIAKDTGMTKYNVGKYVREINKLKNKAGVVSKKVLSDFIDGKDGADKKDIQSVIDCIFKNANKYVKWDKTKIREKTGISYVAVRKYADLQKLS